MIVDPGEHRIEVVRPGRESEEQTFSVRAGEEVRLDIELDEE
ncbi:MAG: carboxypeptidase regulatory-like domain-containing protein [Thermoanaerobaculia bacterium]|nr:carboxypeptidase regulatory-like domain-containing protein [Thermoanaerobaculia bacterium]